MPNILLLILFIFSILSFFWGIYKMIKTQQIKYAVALTPFFLLLLGMFIL